MEIVQQLVYLKKSTEFSPQCALNIKHFYNCTKDTQNTHCTKDESLILIIDTILTKLSYLLNVKKDIKTTYS